jgi:hypothetical protein
MPFYIPKRPPVTHKSSPQEVALVVNQLLDQPKVLALLDEKTIERLRTGSLHDRIDAIFAANLAQIEAARQAALESPVTEFLHKSQQEALAFIKAEPGMSSQDRNDLLEALVSCRNWERDMEPQTDTSAPKRSGSRQPGNNGKGAFGQRRRVIVTA